MPDFDDDKIAGLEARLGRDDPRFARGLEKGRPRRPRRYRRGRAWLAVVIALAAVVAGAVLRQGLLLAAGLVMTAMAVNLCDSAARRRIRPPRP
ncbi:DUF3040 domain-containing protein [Streptomyces sp. NPDC056437]|uniref:DUF3040 domain-containing protein n=1 Tax=Streptomyces sp. NPDC056437 TaxID=3345816 RepID=UPI0036BA520F